MTTDEINKIAMQQSAVELGCKTEDFFQNENKLVSSVCSNKARKDVYKRQAGHSFSFNESKIWMV